MEFFKMKHIVIMSSQQIRWYITCYPTGVETRACNGTYVEKYVCAFDVQSHLDSSPSITSIRRYKKKFKFAQTCAFLFLLLILLYLTYFITSHFVTYLTSKKEFRRKSLKFETCSILLNSNIKIINVCLTCYFWL